MARSPKAQLPGEITYHPATGKRYKRTEDGKLRRMQDAPPKPKGVRIVGMIVWRGQLHIATDKGVYVQSDETPDQFKPVDWRVQGTGEKIG